MGLVRTRGGPAADKVVICHRTGSATNPVVQIEVSVNALPAHQAHGDATDLQNDPDNCGGCGIVCDPESETCQNGTCVNRCAGVVCTAIDQCHDAGTCDPATGACSNPAKADGTACDDGNACTRTDTCQGGVCVGSDPVVCVASDQCHRAGVCDPATGLCSNPAQPDGFPCSDGNACTTEDTCRDGTCVGGAPLECTIDDPCLVGQCVPDRGCVFTPSDDPDCIGGTCGPAGDVCGPGEFCCAKRECCSRTEQYCGGILGCCDDGPGPCRVR